MRGAEIEGQWDQARVREREATFLEGVLISRPSSCFTAGTGFALQRAGTNTLSHMHEGRGGTAECAMPMSKPRQCTRTPEKHSFSFRASFETYLGSVKGHAGEDGLGDACSLQLLSHILVDVPRYVRRSHRSRSCRLIWWRACSTSTWAGLRLLQGLRFRRLGKDDSGSPPHRRVVEVLLLRRGETWAGQHTVNGVLLVEKLGHDQLLVDHLGAERLGDQPRRVETESRATANVGDRPMREKKV